MPDSAGDFGLLLLREVACHLQRSRKNWPEPIIQMNEYEERRTASTKNSVSLLKMMSKVRVCGADESSERSRGERVAILKFSIR